MSVKRKVREPGVYPDTNGKYYLKYKNQTIRGFDTVDDAIIHKAMLKLNENEMTQSEISFEYISLDFIEYEYQRYKEQEVSYSSYIDKESIYRLHISPITKNLKIRTLNANKMRTLRTAIFDYDMSTTHKNNVISVFKAILRHGQKYHEVKEDYTIFLDNFTKTAEEKKVERERLTYIWSNKDFSKFISKVRFEDRRIAFTLFFKHGMRLGEVRALKWSKWNDKDLTLTIDGNITRKKEGGGYKLKSTKTDGSDRVIYVGKVTAKLINDYKLKRIELHGFNEDWFLLGDYDPITEKKIRNEREYAIKESGVPDSTNHEMRHMFVTNAWSKAPITAISRYIGHNDVSVTLKEYSHLSQDDGVMLNSYIDSNKSM